MVSWIAIIKLKVSEDVFGRKTILVMAKSTKDNIKMVSCVAMEGTSGLVVIIT